MPGTQADRNFFNIDDQDSGIGRRLADGVTARIFPGQQAMVSVVRLAPGTCTTSHSHPQEQWGFLLSGSATRIQDGEEVAVGPGDFWVTPGGIEHNIIAGPDGAVALDIFAPPRAEYARPADSGDGGAD